MSDRENPQLRFQAGGFEDRLASAIASLRALLIVNLFVIGFGFLYFVAAAIGSGTPSSPKDFFGAIPLMIALAAAAFLLGKLYVVE